MSCRMAEVRVILAILALWVLFIHLNPCTSGLGIKEYYSGH